MLNNKSNADRRALKEILDRTNRTGLVKLHWKSRSSQVCIRPLEVKLDCVWINVDLVKERKKDVLYAILSFPLQSVTLHIKNWIMFLRITGL